MKTDIANLDEKLQGTFQTYDLKDSNVKKQLEQLKTYDGISGKMGWSQNYIYQMVGRYRGGELLNNTRENYIFFWMKHIKNQKKCYEDMLAEFKANEVI